MLQIIFFIFIIYIIFKKYNQPSPTRLISILQRQGFHNFAILQQNQSHYYMKAELHGDNYLFKVIKENATLSHITIQALMEYATKNHYHNIVLIPGNALISDMAKKCIAEYNIDVWNQAKLNELFKTQGTSSVIKNSLTNDTCKIEESDDPIQNGTKATTILGNLFHQKIERL